jgi:hypothetical protein
MDLLNPSNATLTTLTFTALSTITTTLDALGNPVQTQQTVTVQAIVTPLNPARLADLAPIVGVDGVGIPVKVRVQSWPNAVGANVAIASLTYNGREASIRLAPIKEASIPAQRVASGLGVAAEGVLVYS